MALRHSTRPRPAQPLTQIRILKEPGESGGESGSVARGAEQAGLAVGHDLGNAPACTRNHRQAVGLGFKKGHAVSLVDRRPPENIGSRMEPLDFRGATLSS